MGRISYTYQKEQADAKAIAAAADAPVTVDDIAALAASDERRQLATEADYEKFKHLARGEVFVARAIDPHEGRLASITSSWVPVTESLCTEVGKYGGACGWDAAVACGFKKGWDSIRPDIIMPKSGLPARDHVIEILRQHKATQHAGSSPSHIRTREEAIAARTVRALPEEFIENPRLD